MDQTLGVLMDSVLFEHRVQFRYHTRRLSNRPCLLLLTD